VPTLQFKGKPLVQNHHLVVPFSEMNAVKKLGLTKTLSLHDNLIIEGDSLKALKALLPAYHGKVKCIYIDPPYNTGNEGWIYNDRVNSPMMRDWLGKTVDRDDLTRHDKWCCMMLPRLKLLREFLTDDGAIFVSIDDNEVHHLRALMDEVFGEENFVANVVWRSADSSNNDAKQFSVDHNHTVVYSRQRGWLTRPLERTEDDNVHYTNPDDDPKGPWFPGNLSSPNPRENLRYVVESPSGKKIKPPANGWRWKKETLLEMIESGEIVFSEDETRLIRKTYLKDQTGLAPSSLWDDIEETGHNRNAKYVLKNLFPEKDTADLFKTPKPVKFLLKILRVSTEKDSIILDSFAGSGTTAHAVLALNKEDGGNRRFILCQMPFETKEQKDKNENICESITAERVRRVIKGVKASKAEALRGGWAGHFRISGSARSCANRRSSTVRICQATRRWPAMFSSQRPATSLTRRR
jgi:adenine-specific DNA-methyltransferase